MLADSPVHTIRHLTEDPFLIECGRSLKDRAGNQLATILSVDDIALEHRETDDPETWSEACDGSCFDSVVVRDDPSSSLTADMIQGRISIGDATPVPAAGRGYAIVAHCTIQFTVEYGGGTAKRDFVRRAQIPASFETAPAS